MNKSILHISSDINNCLGTGFIVDKDENGVFVITCGHVVNNCQGSILVDDKPSKVISNKYEDGLDLAILYVEGILLEPLPISSKPTTSMVKVIGFSPLLKYKKLESINDIKINSNVSLKNSKDVKLKTITAIKLSTHDSIASGYSGSPVICQDTNEVIGIVAIQKGDTTNYAINAKHIEDIHNIKNKQNNKRVFDNKPKKELTTKLSKEEYITIKVKFEQNFENSLKAFATQPKIWIEPKLSTEEENSDSIQKDTTELETETEIIVEDIINKPKSLLIQARQQYGLTSLSHYFIKEAWNNSQSAFWLYIDANEIKPYPKEIEKYVLQKLKELKLSIDDIECVVLDEFSSSIKDANKILNNISDFFKDISLVVMMTVVENPLLDEELTPPKNRDFSKLYLWSLSRHNIRKVVNAYNNEHYIEDEDKVVNKVASDLEVLNIPRTPLNCITILKISEIDFDDSPVNRTEMIKRMLFLLFNIDIPIYQTKPDLKDTEFVLGFFCEIMLKNKDYFFTKDYFISTINEFCNENEIDLDLHIIFNILFENNIIIIRHDKFCFKFSYWIFYFAAHRMQQNLDFANYILSDMNYTAYPELIEFYTGIDRSRNDALKTLTKDIKSTCNLVDKKCGLPSDFNIYNLIQWKPSEKIVEKMHKEVSEGVLNSNLPLSVKDQYADNTYDKSRPLNQSIHSILEEYSLLRLMKSISAGAKALRNSDFANPETRHTLLKEILRSWKQIIDVLLVITPILSKQGYATLDGASFVLNGSFGETEEERLNRIIPVIPTNIVSWYRDDLFSNRMGTFLYNHIKQEENELLIHTLNLLIINKRPKMWETHLEKYIECEHKNSFYLSDIYKTLRAEYQYSFSSTADLKKIEKLIKACIAKHEFGIKKISKKSMADVDKKFKNFLPERKVD